MTAKEYKVLCRKKAAIITKFVVWFLVNTAVAIAYFLDISALWVILLINSIWIYGPDVFLYLLEEFYKIKHDLSSYK